MHSIRMRVSWMVSVVAALGGLAVVAPGSSAQGQSASATVVPGELGDGGQAMAATVVSLDRGPWRIAPDPQNVGRDQQWWKGPVADAKPARVPGIIQETLAGYHGVAWYWCEFTPPANPHPQGVALLRFGAVDYLAEVWLNGVPVGGHEGGETPFLLDVTSALRPNAPNVLAVRVLNPTDKPIDGIVLKDTPHRNKGVNLTVGGSYNYGGIIEPVDLLLSSPVRVADLFVRPDWQTGKVRVQATIHNALPAAAPGHVQFAIAAGNTGERVAVGRVDRELPNGDTTVETELEVAHHRLWDLDDPYLYRATARVWTDAVATGDEHAVRFGFRDFRVAKGFFRLNGKRVFLRSSHTGNHCPVGQVVPPAQAPDLLRKDLLYAKSSGFNCIRFIAGMAHPWQLDMCDEIGLMVYEENLSGWLLENSPKMAERFDFSLREMVLRDRNHPSLAIWGLLNETGDGPVFRHAVDSLAMLRSLDDTRLVLLGSGRWDGQLNIGSVSNPGSANWDFEWGAEGPDQKPSAPQWTLLPAFTPGAGDIHVYPATPHTPEIEDAIRALGRDSKPVFLSEYGIGSLMNAIQEYRTYEQNGVDPALDDTAFFRATVEKYTADWKRLGMEGVYASPEGMLRDSQWLHCRQRLLGFNLIRSNPKICGYNLTGLLDHGFTGEGLWTFWREWKPGIVDALKDGWAPLRWCLFVRPMHGYLNRPFKVEAVLANEDVLLPGDYPVALRVMGPQGAVWEQKTTLHVAPPATGEDPPLAIPVFAGDVTISGLAGAYEFAATMEGRGAPAGGRLKFYLSDSAAAQSAKVVAWGIDEKVQGWLKARGIACEPFDASSPAQRQIILVGDLSNTPAELAARTELVRRVAQGGVAAFLSPQALKRGDNSVGWLPLENKGRGYDFSDWLYHKECVAKAHPIFNGLQPKGVMDWDYYGPVISHYILDGQDTPDDVAAAAFALCHSGAPAGYASGVMIGAYKFGEGRIVLNTFKVLENIDVHPAADRLLLNMVNYAAAARTDQTPAPLPPDWDARLGAIGYK